MQKCTTAFCFSPLDMAFRLFVVQVIEVSYSMLMHLETPYMLDFLHIFGIVLCAYLHIIGRYSLFVCHNRVIVIIYLSDRQNIIDV